MKLYDVYRIYHVPTGQSYVGSSCGSRRRIRRHFRELRSNRHTSCKVLDLWNRTQSIDWDHEILDENLSSSNSILSEEKWIRIYKDKGLLLNTLEQANGGAAGICNQLRLMCSTDDFRSRLADLVAKRNDLGLSGVSSWSESSYNLARKSHHRAAGYTSTGYAGVSTTRSGKYRSVIQEGRRQLLIGRFTCAREAAMMYNFHSQRIYGDSGVINRVFEDVKEELND